MGVFRGACHRCIKIGAARVLYGSPHTQSAVGQCGRTIDDHSTGLQPRNQPVYAGHNRLDLRRSCDAKNNHIACRCQRGRGVIGDRAQAGDLIHRLVARMIQKAQIELALAQDVPRNPVAHQTNTDNANFHRSPPPSTLRAA